MSRRFSIFEQTPIIYVTLAMEDTTKLLSPAEASQLHGRSFTSLECFVIRFPKYRSIQSKYFLSGNIARIVVYALTFAQDTLKLNEARQETRDMTNYSYFALPGPSTGSCLLVKEFIQSASSERSHAQEASGSPIERGCSSRSQDDNVRFVVWSMRVRPRTDVIIGAMVSCLIDVILAFTELANLLTRFACICVTAIYWNFTWWHDYVNRDILPKYLDGRKLTVEKVYVCAYMNVFLSRIYKM